MRRLSKRARSAFKRYYTNCANQDLVVWDKAADIEHIKNCLPLKKISYMECSAGTFFISWKDGVHTIHDRKNYWQEVVMCRKEGLYWVRYRDCSGTKLDKPRRLE